MPTGVPEDQRGPRGRPTGRQDHVHSGGTRPERGHAGKTLRGCRRHLPGRTPGDVRAQTAEDVFITNMIKCQAPGNRDPKPDEIEACSEHLDRQMEIIEPDIVVALGKFSLGKFLPGETIGKAGGILRRRKRPEHLPHHAPGRRTQARRVQGEGDK